MQRTTALDVMHQDWRDMIGVGRKEHGTARYPGRQESMNQWLRLLEGRIPSRILVHQSGATPAPDQHTRNQRSADQHRNISALKEFEKVRAQKRNVETQEKRKKRTGSPRTPAPRVPRNDVIEDGRDRHRPGDGDSIGGCQFDRLTKCQHEQNAPNGQKPVDLGNVDLAFGVKGGVLDGDAWKVAQQHRLPGKGERARDERLRSDHGCRTRQQNQQISRKTWRHHSEKWILDRLRVGEQKCALSKIAQQEGGQNKTCPCQANRSNSEVPHIRIQGFSASHHQYDGAEYEGTVQSMTMEECHPMERRQRSEDFRMAADVKYSQAGECRKPDQHDWTE